MIGESGFVSILCQNVLVSDSEVQWSSKFFSRSHYSFRNEKIECIKVIIISKVCPVLMTGTGNSENMPFGKVETM